MAEFESLRQWSCKDKGSWLIGFAEAVAIRDFHWEVEFLGQGLLSQTIEYLIV